MSETVMGKAGAGRRQGRARVVMLAILACAVAGCSIPFGPGSENEPSRTPRDRNRIYLEEQERIERERRTFDAVHPSER